MNAPSSHNAGSQYGWDSSATPHSFEYLIPKLLPIISQARPSRVLDLGSGNGALLALIADELSIEVVGIEPDAHGITIARRANPKIPFYQMSLSDDPQQLLKRVGGTFQLAISTEVVEHLYSPRSLTAFAREVLDGNGQLLVTTPYHGYLKNLALAVTNRWDRHLDPLRDGGHIKFWSRRTITELLAEGGFSVDCIAGAGRIPGLWRSMVVLASNAPAHDEESASGQRAESRGASRTLRALAGTQGLPEQIVQSGSEVATTDPAVTTAPTPTVTPGPTKLCAPIHAPWPTAIECPE